MKQRRIISLFFTAGLFLSLIPALSAADFSGIWIVKKDKYQIVVNKSGSGYSFKKISFWKGKRSEHSGAFTVKGKRLQVKYAAGTTASAVIKSPDQFIESSTVKWEKVKNSTEYPVFSISGKWKHFNSDIILTQKGNTVTGKKMFNGKVMSSYTGQIEGYLLRLKEEQQGARPMELSLLILDNDRILFAAGWGPRDNLWERVKP